MVDTARICDVRTEWFRSVVDSGAVELTDSITVLVGPNGAGKTNFMQSLSEMDGSGELTSENPKYSLESVGDAETDEFSGNPAISYRIETPREFSEELQTLVQPVSTHSVDDDESESPEFGDTVTIQRTEGGSNVLTDGDTTETLSDLVDTRWNRLHSLVEAIEDRPELDPFAGETDGDTLAGKLVSYQEFIESEIDGFREDVVTDLDSDDPLRREYDRLGRIQSDIKSLLTRTRVMNRIKEDPQEALPTTKYFDEIELIDSEIPLSEVDESASFESLLRITGLDTEVSSLDRYDVDRLNRRLQEAERQLTIFLNSYLSIESPVESGIEEAVRDPMKGRFSVDLSVEVREDERILSLSISDSAERGFTTSAAERSTGARWVLSFLLGLIELSRVEDSRGLVMFDDPGLPLHPEWKRRLRHILYEIDTDYQVIYSTHSPFLIENDRPEQVRIVRNHGSPEHGETDQCGTKVVPLHEAPGSELPHDRLEPIRSSLGARVNEFLFGGERNVVVEGSTDERYLDTFSSLFSREHDSLTFDSQTGFITGGGEFTIALPQFLETEQPNFVVLTDSDSGGQSIRDQMSDRGIPESKSVSLERGTSHLDISYPEIEDLLPRHMVCSYAAEHLDASQADLKDAADKQVTRPIVDVVEDESGEDFPKDYVARQFANEVDECWLDPDETERFRATLRFASLIDTLRERLD